MDMEDNKKRYLDKVVDFMIDDTEYNIYVNRFSDHSETKVDIWFPSDEEGYSYSKYDVSDWLNGSGWVLDSGDDMDYVCDTYSICDIDTVQELYNRYIQKLSIMIYPDIIKVERHNSSINESVGNKMTKNEYLDKVVNFIIQDTKFDSQYDNYLEWDQPYWHPPFEEYPFGYGSEVWVDSLFDSSRFKISPLSHDDTPPHLTAFTPTVITEFIGNFYTYCKETYGLTEQETDYAWSRYADFMKKKLNGKNSINESVDRKNEYLNKVVEFLVTDTKVLINDDVFFAPFYRLSSLTYNLLFYKGDYPASFYEYCRNTYSLTDYDTKYVWDTYKNIIKDKFGYESYY
jgi:hypothetical protein